MDFFFSNIFQLLRLYTHLQPENNGLLFQGVQTANTRQIQQAKTAFFL